MDCCIKKYPLTAIESCTASRSDVIRILRDISLKIDDEEFENNKDLGLRYVEWAAARTREAVRMGWSRERATGSESLREFEP